jgi:ferritin-like metal-binding protein YciE
MAKAASEQLIKGLVDAHALESQSQQLLEAAIGAAGDDEIGAVYRAHLMQTEEHQRHVAERLQELDTDPSQMKDSAMQAAALAIGGLVKAIPDSPLRLAAAAYAAENLEVAVYRLLRELAQRAEDRGTVAVVERILEQEEAAVELVAGTFARAVDVTLGQEPTSPVTPVTPIGKPSEREEVPGVSGEPAIVSERFEEAPPSPGEGYPAGDTRPYGE